MFQLEISNIAQDQLNKLKHNPAMQKQYKAVIKSLKYLEENPRHPSLHTHEYISLSKRYGQKVYEAYAENRTSAAYRIFWRYGEASKIIEIMMITPHP